MEIFEANTDYLDELSFIFDSYRQFYKQESDVPTAKKFLHDRLMQRESVIFIAMDESKKINGFVQLYPIFSSVGLKRSWLLNDLFVKKEFRKLGISKMLIERSKKLAKDTNASGLLLETSKENIEGNSLYPSQGFQLENSSNFYFWRNIY